MNNEIKKEVRKELIHLCAVMSDEFTKDSIAYAEHNEHGELAEIAVETILPLAEISLHVQEALGHDAMVDWLVIGLKAAHFDALLTVSLPKFVHPDYLKKGLTQALTEMTISQAKYGQILGLKSKKEEKKFYQAVKDNVFSYYMKNFDTYYAIQKTLERYEQEGDWFSTTAIGVHMYVVHMTANQFGYDADIPVVVIN